MSNTASANTIVALHPTPSQNRGSFRLKPGKPRKISPAPSADEFAYIEAAGQARKTLIASDPLLGVLDERGPTEDVVHRTIVGVAEETAALRWDREQAEAQGFLVAEKIAARRIDGLHKLATTVLEAKKQGTYGDVDFQSAQFHRVEQLFIDTIAETLRETVPTETSTLVIDRLVRAMAAWRASLGEPGGDSS